MAENAGDDHKYAAAESQYRQDETAHNGLILFFAHPLDKDGDVHQINCDDGQLCGIEYERAAPGSGKVAQIKV